MFNTKKCDMCKLFITSCLCFRLDAFFVGTDDKTLKSKGNKTLNKTPKAVRRESRREEVTGKLVYVRGQTGTA